MTHNERSHDHVENDDEYMIPEAPMLDGISALPYTLAIELTNREEISKKRVAAIIPLDATIKSHLDWSDSFQKAQTCIDKGLSIIFSLEMGLFDRLEHPLSHQGQFQALALSCDHFRREAIPRFGEALIGVILYRGPLHMSHAQSHRASFSFDQFQSWMAKHDISSSPTKEEEIAFSPTLRWYFKRFCHEQCCDFIRLLSAQIPDTLHRFVLLDPSYDDEQATSPISPYEIIRQSAKDLSEPLAIALKNSPYIHGHSMWEEGIDQGCQFYDSLESYQKCTYIDPETLTAALLIPSYNTIETQRCKTLQEAIDYFAEKDLSKQMRVVHEAFFTSEWNGLDLVIFSNASLTPEGKRSIKGFEAAGGASIDLDAPDGLLQSVEWLKKNRRS